MNVQGGVAPYSFNADNGGGTSDAVVPKAGEFTFDFNANETFDVVVTDQAGKTATVAVVISTN